MIVLMMLSVLHIFLLLLFLNKELSVMNLFKSNWMDQSAVIFSDLSLCRIPFRTLVVSLLSHQVLLQNLYDILLEEFVKASGSSESKIPMPVSEPKPAGFLRYISMQNLAIIFDLLLDSYRTAREFDTRPGLKYLLMKVSGVCGAANLYRQSAMSFNIYFQVHLQYSFSSDINI